MLTTGTRVRVLRGGLRGFKAAQSFTVLEVYSTGSVRITTLEMPPAPLAASWFTVVDGADLKEI